MRRDEVARRLSPLLPQQTVAYLKMRFGFMPNVGTISQCANAQASSSNPLTEGRAQVLRRR